MNEQDIYRAIGRRVRQRRRLLDMTQSKVARACSVSFQQIQKYEAGASGMPVAKLIALARVLQVPVSYFVDDLRVEQPQRAEGEVRPLRINAA